MDWPADIQIEFDNAEKARSQGNEGRARVCARRAAGMAARKYFTNHGKIFRTPSAYDLLGWIAEDASLSTEARQTAAYLTLRVNEEFRLPPNVDLIHEAKNLCMILLE